MNLSDLLSSVPNVVTSPAADPPITAPVTEDSRAVEPGGVFVARAGGSFDGHRYIDSAVAQGAAAVVGERPPADVDCPVPYVQVQNSAESLAYLAAAYYEYPARKLVMIGVTGTDGKTTTTNLVYSVLRAAGVRAGMISTINAVIGEAEYDVGLHVTTPAAPEVQRYLHQMVGAGLTHCVLEATSHGLAQHRVTACEFDVAAITNIAHEHLDFHGTWDRYRDAKAMLFRGLMQGARKPNISKTAVINADDERSRDYLLAIPAERQITYSLAERATVRASRIAYGPASTTYNVMLGAGRGMVSVQSALVGAFNVSNTLAAMGVGLALDLPTEAIKAGVEAVKAVPGRMERIDAGQDFLAVVDFAHTPNALRVTLETARQMIPEGGRVIVAFGSAGLRDPEKRALMGRIAAERADLTVITAEDPRTEPLADILAASAEAAAEAGGVEGETFWRVPDRGEALRFAVSLARAGDIVLACGKGHEQSMAFGTTEYPWDDREALRAALRGEAKGGVPTSQQTRP